MITIYVHKTQARAELDAPLTSGSVGREVQFQFSDDWAGLTKTAVFETRYCREPANVPDSGTLTIPAAALTQSGVALIIGVLGRNAEGTVVVPTVYADCGTIRPGATTEPKGEPVPPSQATQLQEQINDLADRVSDLEDAGTGDGGASGSAGGYYTPDVKQVDGSTMVMSFSASEADMPEVESQTITLPAGPQGEKGEKGDKGDKGDPGDGAAITFFDLAAMGLPAVTPDGTEVALAADTSEIRTALASGFVKFGFQFSYGGMTIAAELTGAPMYMAEADTYQVSKTGTFAGAPMFISIMISGTGISAVANVLQAALPNAEGASF